MNILRKNLKDSLKLNFYKSTISEIKKTIEWNSQQI